MTPIAKSKYINLSHLLAPVLSLMMSTQHKPSAAFVLTSVLRPPISHTHKHMPCSALPI